MAVYSARQSSYSDGDTITAAHTNDEFNAILATFNVSTGHTHDGSTAGDGGPISNLFSNALVFGTNADTDIAITFNANSNDGVLTWMEDEDYFQFSDDILLTTTEKLQFRDTAIYINSSTDGQLDLVADSEIQIAATTVDINGAVDISGNLSVGGNLDVTGTLDLSDSNFTNVGALQLDSIAGDGDTDTSITFSGSDVITVAAGGDNQVTFTNGAIVPSTDNDIDLGTSSVEFKDAFFDGTVTTDALVADTADINGGTVDGAIIGGSSAAAITGTAITGTSFVIGSANISEAELETIDGVTAGTVAASKAVVVDSNKDIGSFRNVTLTGELDAATLDISGDADIDGTLETDALSINGTTVTSTAAELNLVDGITAGTVSASLAVIADSNKDVTGFRNITLTGELDAATLDISGDADIDGTLEADAITIGGVTLAETISDTVGAMVSSNTETNITVSYDDSDNTLDFVIGTLNQDTTGTAATVTTAAQPNITSLGTLTTLTVDDITINGSTISDGGTLTIDVASNLEFDAGGGLFSFKDDGSEVYRITNSSGDISLKSLTSDKDISIQGNDGGSVVSAVTFDMSDAGTATFNHDIKLSDSGALRLGDDGDAEIYHDGSQTVVREASSGNLVLAGNNVKITGGSMLENHVLCNNNGSVDIYHDNSVRLQTTSSGIDVTGLVEFDSLSGTGSVAITDIADEDDMTSNSATKLSTQQSIKAYADTKAGKGFAVAMAIAL